MEVSTLNTLDTLTNMVFLMVAILPIYIIGLSLIIGDMPRIKVMALAYWAINLFNGNLWHDRRYYLHPMIKVKVNGHLKIITIRNPFTNKWIITFTVPMPTRHVTLTPRLQASKPVASFGNPYRYALGVLAIMALVACDSPTHPETNEDGTKWGVIVAAHPKACIESTPVLPDTIIKGLEAWTLKVGNNTRNRCHYSVESDWVECKAKNPDTLYAIDRYCPATLKARAELGGN